MQPLTLAILLNGMLVWELIWPGELQGGRLAVVVLITTGVHLTGSVFTQMCMRPLAMAQFALLTAQVGVIGATAISGTISDYGQWKLTVFVGLAIIPSFMLLALYEGRSRKVEILLRWMVVCSLLPVLLVLRTEVANDAGLAWTLRTQGSDVIGISRTLGTGAVIAWGLSVGRHAPPKTALLALGVALVSLQVLVGERGPLIASLASASFMWIIADKHPGLPLARLTTVALLGAIMAAVLPEVMPRMTWAEVANDARIDIAYTGLLRWTEAPMAGQGLGAFAYMGTGGITREYFHNLFGELLVECGLLGFATVASWMMLVGVSALRGSRGSDSVWTASVGLTVFSLAAAQVSGDLATNYMVWVSLTLTYCVTAEARAASRSAHAFGAVRTPLNATTNRANVQQCESFN